MRLAERTVWLWRDASLRIESMASRTGRNARGHASTTPTFRPDWWCWRARNPLTWTDTSWADALEYQGPGPVRGQSSRTGPGPSQQEPGLAALSGRRRGCHG